MSARDEAIKQVAIFTANKFLGDDAWIGMTKEAQRKAIDLARQKIEVFESVMFARDWKMTPLIPTETMNVAWQEMMDADPPEGVISKEWQAMWKAAPALGDSNA